MLFRSHAVFVAFLPADAPRYAVSVLLEHAGGGGAQAGPLMREVIKLLLEQEKRETSPPATGVPAAATVLSPQARVPG